MQRLRPVLRPGMQRPLVSAPLHHGQQPPQHRLYAVGGISKRQQQIFTAEDVPALEWWNSAYEKRPRDVSSVECFKAAAFYCKTAREDESTWKGKLERGTEPGMPRGPKKD